ncbi:hypothetical protein DPMN_188968 [Dreissena polymorpha]|uniref:Uncharacterized protein n=1 Tax=Dreissena polymorpha TaxID=45954 RepID=A0A9D4I914_DREPO|nr:hypothetical protein DPMN_188968 [Dreissena polymorpha]
MPWRTGLLRESCLVVCPNQASFCRMTVASKASCGPTSVAVMFMNVLVGLVLPKGDTEQSLEIFMFTCQYPAFCIRVKGPGVAAVE